MHLRECINPLAPNDHCTGRYFVSVFCVGILAVALVQCSRLVGLTAVVGFLAQLHIATAINRLITY